MIDADRAIEEYRRRHRWTHAMVLVLWTAVGLFLGFATVYVGHHHYSTIAWRTR